MQISMSINRRLIYFSLVGGVSTLVHLVVVLGIVRYLYQPPLIANAVGFPIAFMVSFWGHKYLTFSHMHSGKQLRLGHFFIIAATTGIMNEALYSLFLRYTSLNYLLALSIVIGLMALVTYISSHQWACR